jgi:hypothetical protein
MMDNFENWTRLANKSLDRCTEGGEHEIENLWSAGTLLLEIVQLQEAHIAALEARLTKLEARLEAEIRRRQNFEFEGV